MTQLGGNTAFTGTGEFYVMFAGALMNTAATPSATTGYKSTSFLIAGNAYTLADYATYHTFTYTAAYARSAVTWMTTFRGRGGMGTSAH
jgi:uncharacterized membrane protein